MLLTLELPDQIETSPGLLALVAEIAALPKESALFEPAIKTIGELLSEDTTATSEEDPISPAEWNRLWAEFEREMKEIDLADEIADGRRAHAETRGFSPEFPRVSSAHAAPPL